MKKRLVCLLLCLCFTMQLCGCSASNNEYPRVGSDFFRGFIYMADW